jgi:dimeric dUTPase (all-alpha-NTP-PPase superfamily)
MPHKTLTVCTIYRIRSRLNVFANYEKKRKNGTNARVLTKKRGIHMIIATPDLKKLALIQDELDQAILKRHNIQEDVSNRLVIAFKVEFGEFLNEHKFFKFWKVDRTPNTKAVRTPAMMEEYNPLLEEFVDGIHFLLSIGNQRKYLKYTHAFEAIDRDTDSLEYLAMEIFNNPINSAGRWLQVVSDYLYFGHLVGITPLDIEQAYLIKNVENHRRQQNGY